MKASKMAELESNDDGEATGFDESYQEKYVKPVRLSLHLIVKRHLPKEATELPQEEIISELNKIRRLRLDRENIGEIDSLELLSADVTHMYLQCNRISCIQNLECLPNLQILVLSNNQITKVEGISHLQKLVFLELSENCIESVDTDELPQSLVILNLSDNKCSESPSHRSNLIKALPKLKQLDGKDVTTKEKIQAGIPSEFIGSDEGDEDDDNDDEEDEDKDMDASLNTGIPAVEGLQGKSYKQLPKIQTSIQDFATEMLVRSQRRLEDAISQHKRHVQEITNIRIKSRIRPEPHINLPKGQ